MSHVTYRWDILWKEREREGERMSERKSEGERETGRESRGGIEFCESKRDARE